MKDKTGDNRQLQLGEGVGKFVRRRWQSLQNGSNDMVKRIVASYRRFAAGKYFY